MFDALANIADYIIKILAAVGAAAGELVIFLPFILLVILWVMVGNYREELTYKRLHFSRIREIDELSPYKYYLFIKAFLEFMGFSEDILPAKDEEEKTNDSGEDAESILHNKSDQSRRENKRAGIGQPFILVKDDVRYGVLLERRRQGLGQLAFNKLEEIMGKHECAEGMIINNGFFTEADLAEGEARNIELRDRKWLIKALLEVQGLEDTEGKSFRYYFHDFWRWALRN
ncbi:MAG TPA: hypothetical protein GXZ24_02495 [Firmicutes bacterium]|jgi:HJR/Mrr/RecB family endonuclease|nr:hypothetical protein [Bacillota bacterium]